MSRVAVIGFVLAAVLRLMVLPALDAPQPSHPAVFRDNPLVPSATNFPYLFKSLPRELERVQVGTAKDGVPRWIQGAWVKTGFCVFDNNRFKTKMLFDASGCAYQFDFPGGGEVFVNAKRLQSRYYDAMKADKYPLWRTFEEFEPPRRGLDKILTLLSQDQADNYLVNLVSVGKNRIAAITDLAGELELDAFNLSTKGLIKWNDDLERDKWNMLSCAHPSRVASRKGMLYNDLLNLNIPLNMLMYGKPFVYNVIEVDTTQHKRRLIGTIPTDRHYYVHENALTNKFLIIIEFPFIWNFVGIVTNTAIKNALKFVPSLGIRFKVVNLSTGTLEKEFHLPDESFYAFHQINAHEQGTQLVLTMTAYDDIGYHLQKSFLLEGGHLNNTFDLPPATIRRVVLDLATGQATTTKLGTVDMELPIVSDALRGTPLKYVYAHSKSISNRGAGCKAGPGCGGTWWDSIVKVDLQDGGRQVLKWRRDDFWPSEPAFVPRPGSKAEDDGVLLNVLLGDDHKSYLLLLDARNFTQLALLTLPTHFPYQSHGSWYFH